MPDGPATPLPLIDADEALRRAGGRAEVASELHGLLRHALDDSAATLEEASRAGDVARLREAAHRLHGASLYCGVPRLHAETAELERLCADEAGGDPDRLGHAVAALLETIAATRAAGDPLTRPGGE